MVRTVALAVRVSCRASVPCGITQPPVACSPVPIPTSLILFVHEKTAWSLTTPFDVRKHEQPSGSFYSNWSGLRFRRGDSYA